MTALQARICEILSKGPMYPWALYQAIWPDRKTAHGSPSRGGPDSMSVAIHRMMGRKGFRKLFRQDSSHLSDPQGPGVRRYCNRSERESGKV
jgi:hypothetical protein